MTPIAPASVPFASAPAGDFFACLHLEGNMTPNQTVSHRPLCAISTMAIVLCVLISTAAAAEVPVGCETKIDPPLRDFSQPPNLNLFKRELLYYRCTRYDTDIGLVLREAQDWVKRRAPQVNNPAIVLDIDETSLSNWKR